MSGPARRPVAAVAVDPVSLAALGPYFALVTGHGDGGSWRPVTGLLSDPAELAGLLDDTAARVPAAPAWVVASLFYQGWAARLTSVFAGSVVLGHETPDLSAARLSYQPREPGPVALRASPLITLPPGQAFDLLMDAHLDPLATAVRAQVRIGRELLRGNLASALAGSLLMIAAAGHGDLAELAGRPWASPPALRRYGDWRATPAGPRYVRTTCCGYDQLPGGGKCADCSLAWRGR